MSNSYAAYAYGTVGYEGTLPLGVTPADSQLGIPFIAGNDRYQVVVCADRGTSAAIPSFRYWYAGAPLWNEELSGDSRFPHYYGVDENGASVSGELQLTDRTFDFIRQTRRFVSDVTVDMIEVSYIPRPSGLGESIAGGTTIGFTGRVEGYGVNNYRRMTTTSASAVVFSGVAVSDSFTFRSTASEQASNHWPEVHTTVLPVRLSQRVRTFRLILTDITLCEIVRVTLLGDLGPIREA